MENLLENKVVVLTGAGGGIGRAIAIKLAECGAKLVLLGGNNVEKLNRTAQALANQTDHLVLPGDLTDPEFLKAGINRTAAHFNCMDILINNAGVTLNKPFAEVTTEDYDKLMLINSKVPFLLTQCAIPHLLRSDSATIINIASVVAHAGYAMQSVYSASKHAMLGWTKSLAAEYYRHNIRVHAIAPGGVYTDMVKISRPDLTPEGMIMPEEIAEIVWFFLAHRGNAVIDEIIVHRMNKEPFLV
ncbi:MAG: SDR family oxidoreductase [Lentisphaerae bacterium]|nr:SDR family oxidoreductase [Lentisphaerota bacterium]